MRCGRGQSGYEAFRLLPSTWRSGRHAVTYRSGYTERNALPWWLLILQRGAAAWRSAGHCGWLWGRATQHHLEGDARRAMTQAQMLDVRGYRVYRRQIAHCVFDAESDHPECVSSSAAPTRSQLFIDSATDAAPDVRFSRSHLAGATLADSDRCKCD